MSRESIAQVMQVLLIALGAALQALVMRATSGCRFILHETKVRLKRYQLLGTIKRDVEARRITVSLFGVPPAGLRLLRVRVAMNSASIPEGFIAQLALPQLNSPTRLLGVSALPSGQSEHLLKVDLSLCAGTYYFNVAPHNAKVLRISLGTTTLGSLGAFFQKQADGIGLSAMTITSQGTLKPL
jgi:hypothetical protein